MPPAYLTNPDGEQVKFDFSPIMSPDKRQEIQKLSLEPSFKSQMKWWMGKNDGNKKKKTDNIDSLLYLSNFGHYAVKQGYYFSANKTILCYKNKQIGKCCIIM